MKLADALDVCPIIAILRGICPDEIVFHAEALIAAGVRIIEVPLNSPQPLESLRRLAMTVGDRALVGVGTVTSEASLPEIAALGGRLIVSPNVRADVIRSAMRLGLEAVPGFASPTEGFVAIEAGARYLKLFPAETYGPGYLRQLYAVIPTDVTICVVGGVSRDNVQDWQAAGARAFGFGKSLYQAQQSVEETADKARVAVDMVMGRR